MYIQHAIFNAPELAPSIFQCAKFGVFVVHVQKKCASRFPLRQRLRMRQNRRMHQICAIDFQCTKFGACPKIGVLPMRQYLNIQFFI